MTKLLSILLPVIIVFNSSYGQEKEEKKVRRAFEAYKSAILNDKGEEALNHIDSKTIKYYSDIVDLVKNGDSAKVNSLSLLDKIMVFSVRHRAPRESILSLDGKGLLVYAIKSGMVGKGSVANNAIGDVTIDGTSAKGQFVTLGEKSPFYFHFYKEEGQWKIDLTSAFTLTTQVFRRMVDESGQEENEYLFSLLEKITGRKPGAEIWKKVN